MTAADIAREAQWGRQNAAMKQFFGDLMVLAGMPRADRSAPSRFPAAVANLPAFTQSFNARLVAVGMAATNGHRRLVG